MMLQRFFSSFVLRRSGSPSGRSGRRAAPAAISALRAPPAAENASSRQALERAVGKLRAAKTLHDELETVIRPFMDFDALDAYTERCLAGLFASC